MPENGGNRIVSQMENFFTRNVLDKSERILVDEMHRLMCDDTLEFDSVESHMLYDLQELLHGSRVLYRAYAMYLFRHGISHVADLGCCFGYQSRYFTDLGIRYLGVEEYPMSYYSSDRLLCEYITGRYPMELPIGHPRVVMSSLCVGYTLHAYRELSCDFDLLLVDRLEDDCLDYLDLVEVVSYPYTELGRPEKSYTGGFLVLKSKKADVG